MLSPLSASKEQWIHCFLSVIPLHCSGIISVFLSTTALDRKCCWHLTRCSENFVLCELDFAVICWTPQPLMWKNNPLQIPPAVQSACQTWNTEHWWLIFPVKWMLFQNPDMSSFSYWSLSLMSNVSVKGTSGGMQMIRNLRRIAIGSQFKTNYGLYA